MSAATRTFSMIALFTLFALTGSQASSGLRAAPSFPSFAYDRVLLDPANLSYNPTDEIIFPSIIKASDYFSNPLGTYYLYYAPHDSPGGISLAYANSVEGPWTEYASNPIIDNSWSPHYSVSHISSPHALWIADEGKLFLWFHGENSVTRYATSSDGITFTYGGVAVTTANFSGISESSYARVFAYSIPSKGNRYIMLLMGNNGGTRKIYLAWSNDARSWTTKPTPLISPSATPNEGGQIAGPWYFPWQGGHYVIHATGVGNLHATEVGAEFNQEIHHGVFYDSLSGPPDNGRASAPVFLAVGSTLYMLYEAGTRNPVIETKIALAKAPLTATTVTLDNGSPGVSFSGTWSSSTKYANRIGADYRHDGNAGKGSKSATYTPNLPAAGSYTVQIWWPGSDSLYATNVPAEIHHSGGVTTVTLNQQQSVGQWNTLGTFGFHAGNVGKVVIKNAGTNGYVVADAVRFVRQ